MKLTKNPEIVKLIVLMLALLAAFAALAYALGAAGMRYFHETVTVNQAAIVGAVLEHYPEAEPGIVRQIKAADEEAVRRGQAVIARYGLTDADLLYDTKLMRDNARLQTAFYLSLALGIFTVLAVVFAVFVRRQYRSIRDVHAYARSITEGTAQLDLRDNDEGELSLLKNEIYKITAMLKEQTDRLTEDKNRLADSIADISHQLKTPMTSLSVMTDLLEANPAEEARREFVRRIRSQLNRMEWLATSLLKLSKFDAGTVTMKKETYPVRALVDQALETLSVPLEIKMLEVTITGDDDIRLIGDKAWTCEALINILKNCIEHTPERGRIRIAYEDNPIYTAVTIADNGEGIAPEDLPYIFNRFYKGKNARDDSVGIGLAMAYAIVRKQDGDIAVQSRKGVGTTFTVTFYKQVI